MFGAEAVTIPSCRLCDSDSLLPLSLPPIIDTERMQPDFHQVKVFLRSGNFPGLQAACQKLYQVSEMFPDYDLIAQVVMASPITSVACERSFSVQNRLITNFRARLLTTYVAKLKRIMQEGPNFT